jgi:hypothetical protein
MNAQRFNSDGNGGALLTLIRVLASGEEHSAETELEEAYYSDWAPKKGKAALTRPQTAVVLSSPPSVTFLQDGHETSLMRRPTSLLFALCSVALFTYAVPILLKFLAYRHLSPWAATILPGDIAGCVWLATVCRMRFLAVLLYVLLTASEGCLYVLGLVDAGSLVWISDLIPAVCVAAVTTRMSQVARA